MALSANQQAFLRIRGGAHHDGGTNDPAGTGLVPGQTVPGAESGIFQVGHRVFSTKNAGWREAMCLALGIS